MSRTYARVVVHLITSCAIARGVATGVVIIGIPLTSLPSMFHLSTGAALEFLADQQRLLPNYPAAGLADWIVNVATWRRHGQSRAANVADVERSPFAAGNYAVHDVIQL